MSEQNMMQAANQYAYRPKDERFASVDAMIANALGWTLDHWIAEWRKALR